MCFKSITIEDKKNTKEQKEYGLCDKAVSKGRVTEKARSEQRYRLAETVYILWDKSFPVLPRQEHMPRP